MTEQEKKPVRCPQRKREVTVCRRALGHYPESTRVATAVPRGHAHGLFTWFLHPDSPASFETEAMRAALASQGYDVTILKDAAAAIATLKDHLSGADTGSP